MLVSHKQGGSVALYKQVIIHYGPWSGCPENYPSSRGYSLSTIWGGGEQLCRFGSSLKSKYLSKMRKGETHHHKLTLSIEEIHYLV